MKNKIFKTFLLSASLSLKAYSMHVEHCFEEESNSSNSQHSHDHNGGEFEHKSQGQLFSENVRNGLQGKEHALPSQFQDVPESERYVRLAIEMILESLRLQEMGKNQGVTVKAETALNAGQDMFAYLIQSSAHNYNYEHNYEYENSDNSSVHSSNNWDEEYHNDGRAFTIYGSVHVFVDKDEQYYYINDYEYRIDLDGEYYGKVFEDGNLKLTSGKMHNYGNNEYQDDLYYDVKTNELFTGKCNNCVFQNGKKLLKQRDGITYDCKTKAPANGRYVFPTLYNPATKIILTFENGEFVSETEYEVPEKFEIPLACKNSTGYEIAPIDGLEYHEVFKNAEKEYKKSENINKINKEQSQKEEEALYNAMNYKLSQEENQRLSLFLNKQDLTEKEKIERDALVLRKNARKYYDEMLTTKDELEILKTQNEALEQSRGQFAKIDKSKADESKKIKREFSRTKRGASRVKHHN